MISSGMERWVVIEGYEDYQVSNLGRIKSLKYNKERILSSAIDKLGYARVNLSDGKCKLFTVHRLVAKAFIPNPDNKPYIDHIDRNPRNNSAVNLRWATPSENCINQVRPNNTTGEKYIIKRRDYDYYKVQIRAPGGGKMFYKTFHNLQDAITARDSYLQEAKL